MFLVEYGVDIIGKEDRSGSIPKFVEEVPEVYDDHEVEKHSCPAGQSPAEAAYRHDAQGTLPRERSRLPYMGLC